MIFKKDFEIFTAKLRTQDGSLPLWRNFLTFAEHEDVVLSVWGYEIFLKTVLKDYRKHAKRGWGIESFAEFINQKYPPLQFDGGEE